MRDDFAFKNGQKLAKKSPSEANGGVGDDFNLVPVGALNSAGPSAAPIGSVFWRFFGASSW